MQERHPQDDDDTEEAREGTAAHWVAIDQVLLLDTRPALGALAPNGHPVAADMLEGADMLAEDVDGVMAEHPRLVIHGEKRVAAARSIHPDNWGTPDVYLIDRARRVLYVWDYKFGHKFVDVYRNWQLVDYVACIFEAHGLAIGDMLDWRFVLTVVQPRCFHSDGAVREWQPSGRELVDMANALRVAAYATLAPDAKCRTGPHCYKCTAAFDCQAHLMSGQNAVDLTAAAVPLSMSPNALALWKRQVDQAAARLKAVSDAVDERLMGVLRSGQRVPGFAIGSTSPLERWRDGAGPQVAQIGDMFGIDLRKPDVPLVTPKQAAKLGIDRAVINQYAETPPGAPKLVKTDETTAFRVFGVRDEPQP